MNQPRTTSAQNNATRAQAARSIIVFRSRWINSRHTDEFSREMWENASIEYFNVTGREHPMGRIPMSARNEHPDF